MLLIPASGQRLNDPVASDPIAGILAAFRQNRLVGISEVHGLQEEHDFLVRLVSDDRFAAAVRNIMVEFGNALYQAEMDRYISGENVPETEVA